MAQTDNPCPKNVLTETKEEFAPPKLKKPTTTRSRCFEQFMWQELFDEYIRYNDRLMQIPPTKDNSEYFEEFCKHIPKEDEAAKEALMNRYPLYCTTAVTLWNHEGDITKDFKKRYVITRPINEQTEQWG